MCQLTYIIEGGEYEMRKDKIISMAQLLNTFQKTLGRIDNRLLNHNEEVAYIVWKVCSYVGRYKNLDIIKFTVLAFFHDIGAFKNEEIDEMMSFETEDFLNHSIYGGLYIKYFSPIPELWEVILYHHVNYENRGIIISNYKDEIFTLHLADRISILLNSPLNKDSKEFYNLEEKVFGKKYIDLFIKVDGEEEIIKKIRDKSYRKELYGFLERVMVPRDYVMKFVKMMVFFIDFRSPYTVTHSISVTAISLYICEKLGMDKGSMEIVTLCAFIHDIGKLVTPIEILEKPGKLTEEEMTIMKDHALVTYNILKDLGFNTIAQISSYHHEKLDGSGYPFGLKGDEICLNARIIAVADIFSALIGERSYKKKFPKEKVIEILEDMAENNKIDRIITKILIDNYQEAINILENPTCEISQIYEEFKGEYNELSLINKIENNIII